MIAVVRLLNEGWLRTENKIEYCNGIEFLLYYAVRQSGATKFGRVAIPALHFRQKCPLGCSTSERNAQTKSSDDT